MFKITECHVTIGETSSIRSTFVLSKPEQMESCAQLIQSYINERIVFTVTYS